MPGRVLVTTLLGGTSLKTRLFLLGATLLAVVARASVIWAAIAVARSDARAAAVIGISAAMLYAFERAVMASARVAVECDLHRMTARALVRGDVLAVPTDDLARVAYDGVNHGLQLLTGILPSLAADGLVAVVAAPLLVAMLPARVVVLALAALFIVAVGIFAVRRATQRLEQRARDAYQALSDSIAVALEGRLELVARSGEEELIDLLERQLVSYERHATRAAYGAALLGRAPIAAALAAVGVVAAADATSRDLIAGAVVAHALVLAVTLRPMFSAIVSLHGAIRTLTFVKPFVELLSAPPRPDAIRVGGQNPRLPGTVESDGLAFAYDPTSPVLSQLSFAWSGAEPLVIVGPNGSGKSTLLRLLLGLRPPVVGGLRIGGHDLGELDVRALRRTIAYLPQRPYLGEAHGSVRGAMRMADAEASDAAILRALSRTGVLGALEGRTDPLAVPIGELSAGQRQRVALARVLLKDGAKMVLLDEPDANLDRDGIALTTSLVRELVAAGKMVIVIAHTTELTAISGRRVELGPFSTSAGQRT